MKKPLSRRTLLRGAGGIAIALPFLQAMTAFGQTAPAKKRLITLFTPNGTVRRKWLPSGSGTNFALPEILQPLAPHKADLLILDGVANKSSENGGGDGAHMRGMSHLWTGTEMTQVGGAWLGGGISIDQRVANAVAVDATGKSLTPFRSLQLRAGPLQGGTLGLNRMIYAGAGKPLTPETDPFTLYNSLFSSVGTDTATLNAIAQKKSILDAAMDDYRSLEQQVGPADRLRLDEHLTSIREIEQRLSATSTGGAACEKPTLGATFNPMSVQNYPKVCDLMVDMLAMALVCDLTRVGSLQFSQAVSQVTFSWLGQSTNHHAWSHEQIPESLPAGSSPSQIAAAEEVEQNLVAINRWYAERVARLIARLKAAPEGTGSVLDNTLVVWGNELSRGNNHSRKPIPFVLAGSCGKHFRTGRFLTYPTVPHNNLLVSILNAFGVSGATFGNPAYCTGPLANLT